MSQKTYCVATDIVENGYGDIAQCDVVVTVFCFVIDSKQERKNLCTQTSCSPEKPPETYTLFGKNFYR